MAEVLESYAANEGFGPGERVTQEEIEAKHKEDLAATTNKNSQMFMTALNAAEDDADVQAARTVCAEAAAELAEFDENIPLDEIDVSFQYPSLRCDVVC